ncbi:hypothetical protein [Prosthecobacter sp.]|uniref:hypothetical protein n=1 Tax=Prosthecobacter sp. TaxID=1965333 RepID=UPI00378394BD
MLAEPFTFGCLVDLFVIAMLWFGGQGLQVALNNRAPLEISAKDWIAGSRTRNGSYFQRPA